MERYSTQSEADAVLEQSRKDWGRPYCPLLRSKCITTCVCFSAGSVHKANLSSFHVYPAECANVMFFGPE